MKHRYGLKWLLSVVYLAIIPIIRYGFKLFELTREHKTSTYIFCPKCGNSVSANAPEEIKEEAEEQKLYRTRKNLCVTGLSQGIADYTGIPVLWIRLNNILWAACGIYFLIAICIPFVEDIGVESNKKFEKAKEGKLLLGICKGISNYTEIHVFWIRAWAVILGAMIFPAIIYLLFGLCYKQGDKKFAKAKKGKVFFGLCKGISNYGGISVVWIRLLAVILGFTIIPAILYVIFGLCIKNVEE